MGIYDTLWHLGTLSGCHQAPERSFKFRGKQFPVCARCTGVFAGYIVGIALYRFFRLPLWLVAVFCLIMFIDWLIQRIGILTSTNPRRFITGLLCGAGLVQCHIWVLLWLCGAVKNILSNIL